MNSKSISTSVSALHALECTCLQSSESIKHSNSEALTSIWNESLVGMAHYVAKISNMYCKEVFMITLMKCWHDSRTQAWEGGISPCGQHFGAPHA